MLSKQTIDHDEITKFQAMADEWWDPTGKFKPLHMLNPCRLQYITDQIAIEFSRDQKERYPFKNLSILDIGCGGGLLSEPMARLGGEVVGVDASEKSIAVARIHAAQSKLEIDYRYSTSEQLVSEGETFDIILNMEVIEHVSDPLVFLSSCENLLRPGGIMICSTINKTLKSYLYAIIGAEYVMRWLPKGTHDWSKFFTPDELFDLLQRSGLKPVDKKGFVFDKIKWHWLISEKDLTVNYVTLSVKEK